jgi:hypothetical protein
MVARSLRLLFGLVVAVASTVIGLRAPAAEARAAYPLDPSANIALPRGAWGAACTDHPMRRTCERIMIRGLNHGRAVLGEPAYVLPARFTALRAGEQLLVLANQDRSLYGRAPIAGLNATLNATAQRGADAGTDPAFVPVGGRQVVRGGADWAGGLASPLGAYFLWMYEDARERWLHRHTVLMSKGAGSNVLIIGVGWSPDAGGMPSWAMVLEAFLPSTLIQTVPTLLSLSARPAGAAAGSPVRLFGFGFLHVQRVTFGGVPATFTRTSLFTISAVPPPHDAGTVRVKVVTAGGTSGAAVYTY